MLKSNVINYNDMNANMYGCQPCPKCKSRYRAPFKKKNSLGEPYRNIECDECGHKEAADELASEP